MSTNDQQAFERYKTDLLEKRREYIRRQSPWLNDAEVEIELASEIEHNAKMHRAQLELESEGALSGLNLGDAYLAITQRAFGDVAEQIRRDQDLRELGEIKRKIKRQQSESEKLENLLDLPNKDAYTTDFLLTRLSGAGIEIELRTIQKWLKKRTREGEEAPGQRVPYQPNREEAQELLTYYWEQNQKLKK